jgi:phospholipase/carboxylesterase
VGTILFAAFVATLVSAGDLRAADQGPRFDELETRNSSGRSGTYYVPAHDTAERMPVLVALHGTGGSGRSMVAVFQSLAEARRFIIVAPDSRRSPSGHWTWQVADRPGEVTDDLAHVVACLDEVTEDLGSSVDLSRVLIVGHSGGASSAPYIATNRGPFSGFGVLHGGVFAGGLGSRRVPGWFSTGANDGLRPPEQVESAMAAARARGFSDLTFEVFPGGHGLSPGETAALIEWWLGSP